jgi:hypothetical protein
LSKQVSSWKKLASASAAARRNVQALLGEVERLSVGESDAISACRSLATELAAWETEGASLATRARDLLHRLESDKNVQSETLEQRLRREFTRNGHSVFGETSLLVVDGIVHVQADAAAGIVKINEIPSEELDVKVIAERVRDEAGRLRRLITPPNDLLKALFDAYEREIRMTGAPRGSQVHAAAVALQVALLRQPSNFRSDPAAKHFREYPRALFRADLYTLLASREAIVKGSTFRHAAGADTTGAVFMLEPGLGRMAHVGRIWFETGSDRQ